MLKSTFPLLVLTFSISTSSHAEGESIGNLAWLAGCWASETSESGTGEQWMNPAGGSMLGMSRTIKDGQLAEFEFMQIRRQADGSLAFIAQPSGGTPTVFTLMRMDEAEAVFENPAHDFPQRVIYSFERPSKLAARVEGSIQGETRVIEFPMRRAKCD